MIDDNLRDELEAMALPDLAKELVKAKSVLESIKADEKKAQSYVDYIAKELLPDRMDQEGISSVKFEGIGRLQKSAQIQCSVRKDDKNSLHEFLREHGYGDMISETVHPSTLKAWAKELITDGIEVPEQVNVHHYQVATVVKA